MSHTDLGLKNSFVVGGLCRISHSLIGTLMSSINMQTRTSTAVHIVCMLILIPTISWSLFSVSFERTANLVYIGPDQVCIVGNAVLVDV